MRRCKRGTQRRDARPHSSARAGHVEPLRQNVSCRWRAHSSSAVRSMGVLLTPIIVKQPLTLEDLRGQLLAVDGHGELYQFLALIRLRDGTPLRDSHDRVTSHLAGLFYRVTRLIADHGLRLVFVFDGTPPVRKPPSSSGAGTFARGTKRSARTRCAPAIWPPHTPKRR